MDPIIRRVFFIGFNVSLYSAQHYTKLELYLRKIGIERGRLGIKGVSVNLNYRGQIQIKPSTRHP
jgi:hypothetical protein